MVENKIINFQEYKERKISSMGVDDYSKQITLSINAGGYSLQNNKTGEIFFHPLNLIDGDGWLTLSSCNYEGDNIDREFGRTLDSITRQKLTTFYQQLP